MLKKTITTKILILIISILIVSLVYVKYPIKHENIDSLFSNIFKVSSIIVTLFIAYIITKVFRIRTEKEKRKEEIDKLSFKITEFRRLLYHVMKCRGFWGDFTDIEKLKRYYPEYLYNDLHNDNHNDEKISKFWSEEDRFSTTRADVYLAFKEIAGTDKIEDWILNDNITFDYTTDDLAKYYYPSSVPWYYFSHKWHKHSKGLFDFNELAKDYHRDDMKRHISNIDEKFDGRELDRHLLADVGSEIHEKYIEKIYELTRINEGKLPKTVRTLIGVIVVIGVFGVILPLIGNFGDFPNNVDSIIAYISVTALVASLIWILLDFTSIIKEEIKI